MGFCELLEKIAVVSLFYLGHHILLDISSGPILMVL